MINLELNGKTIEFKNKLSDFKIYEFQKMISFFKEDYELELDQYTDILQIVTTLSKDELEEMKFTDLVQLINLQKETEANNFKDSFYGRIQFHFEGKTYQSSSNGIDFDFSTKEMFTIKDLINKNPDAYISNLAAVLFLELDNEGIRIKDYSKKSIEEREKIFLSSMDMDLISPYILKLAPYFVDLNVEQKS